MEKLNHFFYTRREPKAPEGTSSQVQFENYIDSINLNKVIRTVEMSDKLLVLLDDIHERPVEVPTHSKNGKVISYKMERQVFQTEVYLEGEDIQRFRKAMGYEG